MSMALVLFGWGLFLRLYHPQLNNTHPPPTKTAIAPKNNRVGKNTVNDVLPDPNRETLPSAGIHRPGEPEGHQAS